MMETEYAKKGWSLSQVWEESGLCRYWCSAWRPARRRQAIARAGAVLQDFGN